MTRWSIVVALLATAAWAQPEPRHESAAPKETKAPSAAAGGSAAPAAPESAASMRLFRELDRNGDGYLTDDELWSERGRQGNWAAVDRDDDGRISPSEFIVLPR